MRSARIHTLQTVQRVRQRLRDSAASEAGIAAARARDADANGARAARDEDALLSDASTRFAVTDRPTDLLGFEHARRIAGNNTKAAIEAAAQARAKEAQTLDLLQQRARTLATVDAAIDRLQHARTERHNKDEQAAQDDLAAGRAARKI